jgi:hypothetical protein
VRVPVGQQQRVAAVLGGVTVPAVAD